MKSTNPISFRSCTPFSQMSYSQNYEVCITECIQFPVPWASHDMEQNIWYHYDKLWWLYGIWPSYFRKLCSI